jgi:uncharacterized protein (DUF1778 family)
MSKNHRIEARVSEDTKRNLLRKAEAYGGITNFLEIIARKDIVILDENASKAIKVLIKGGK